ncbi:MULTISPECIES: alternative ribosome rescue aminoacyl-tRNA hydrolase ArfB [Oceanimonas]|uniref:Aminoacyl-tRNA hydrolase n=1 Tax=Oceanimonas doudoroffii TaxID=84158 RepID=A0A233RKB0_9GAMM|nr:MULTISPECIES: alternative ribosome rescue aminoacyl-tRNA hydrolase ArfB [Oceanimonas]NHH99836.1 Peptidyl-tRNA hydrolase ArfB [Oceanimonas sp. MB9]OXY83827.1 aminoacyl-tRNA hydrolase [Oceanimonas doudoroffii]
MLEISARVSIPERELEFITTRAGGPGGQHVNKTDSAVQLRFDYASSPSLPEGYKEALAKMRDHRVLPSGWILIRVESERSQLMNREAAREALVALLQKAGKPVKVRRPTKPSRAAKAKRTDSKTHRGKIKSSRGKVKF